jgi:hypothetical protein
MKASVYIESRNLVVFVHDAQGQLGGGIVGTLWERGIC